MSNSSLSSTPPGVWQGKHKIAKQLIGLLGASLLVWFCFKGANLAKVLNYAAQANPFFLVLMCLSAICSHFVRAWRWTVFLRPLKENKISLWHSFCAVIYGYAVNIVIPRGGEVVRFLSIAKMESIPWAGVLPTLLIDRLLDLITIAALIGCTIICLPSETLKNIPWLYPSGIAITIGSLSALLLLPKIAPFVSYIISIPGLKRIIPVHVSEKVQDLLKQFSDGTKCLTNPVTYPIIALSTVIIWTCYWLNFYFVMLAFGIEKELTFDKGLTLFTVSSLGSLVPTPGCVGGFHLLVSKSLILIFHTDENLALAYATVLHAFAFVISICLTACVCLLWEGYANNRAAPR